MASDTDVASRPDGGAGENRLHPLDAPSTPQDVDIDVVLPSSQQTLPSTEGPASPIELGQSFKTEVNDDRIPSSSIIPSSLTPPPSSQVPSNGGGAATGALGYVAQRSAILSPPVTGLNTVRPRDAAAPSGEYVPPTPAQVVEASPDELRSMLQACIAEHAKLKMETAHHKLQFNLLALQADEDAKRAAVEHEMTRREVEALRMAEHSRQARRELSAVSESAHAKYLQLKVWYDSALEENDALQRRLKAAKKVIQQKEEETFGLTEERDLLLTRIRENREHFHQLCSPGGMFHGALTPKTQSVSTPVQYRATPRQTPRSAQRDSRPERDHNQESLAALLQVLSQENNSAPSTPTSGHRPAARLPPKHTRGVQSLSSLPTTPTARSRGGHAGLLPSVDLVPQTEPPRRYNRGFIPETPTKTRERGRKSRESTISADDNEELARQALDVAASLTSKGSQGSRSSRHQPRRTNEEEDEEEEEEVFESQASQAASEMLRRDPRESFEVASSVGSRDGTPVPAAAEKSAKLQARLFAGLNKGGMNQEKRKFSSGSGADLGEDSRREMLTSPTKKLRMAGGLREGGSRVGLGIQYSQEA